MLAWLGNLNGWIVEHFWTLLAIAWALGLCVFGLDWYLRRQERNGS